MKNLWLLDKVENSLRGNEYFSFSAYHSLAEEAINLSILAKNSVKPVIVVKENNYLANRLREILVSYFEEDELVCYLPEESLRAEEIASSFENRAERLNALYSLIKNKNIKLVITTGYGYIRHLPEHNLLKESLISLKTGDVITKEDLSLKLKRLGYEKVNRVETPMTYASRGYILDIYSINYRNPVRIEFFDDEIDSIRFFDINTQSTVSHVNECEIVFAKDVFFSDEEKEYLKKNVKCESGQMELDLEYIYNDLYVQSQYFYRSYFKNEYLYDYLSNALVYFSNLSGIRDHLKLLSEETVAYIQEMHEEKRLPLRFSVYGEFEKLIRVKDSISAQMAIRPFELIEEIDLPFGNSSYLVKVISSEPYRYKLLIVDDKHYDILLNDLKENKLEYYDYSKVLIEGINVIKADVYGGFELSQDNLAVYTTSDIFKGIKHKGRYSSKYTESISLDSYEELNKGDYVVHDQYGIGQFVDIESRTINGITSDYLRIVYKGNDELLVPLNQFSLVRKYVSKEGVIPKLHKLGTNQWQKTKQRVEENVEQLAGRLLELYAERENEIGFAFSKDDEMQKEFAETFEFDLTPDQAKAIEEVKSDMESKKPMDRLLCGDVGFGKTEVALRAAFKAINDNKQVAYLCPTTVLSAQHYKTFKSRLQDFPGRVELLNRFVDEKTQKEIVNDLKEGKVDILIGTHRILSGDIVYKDLGLLIIDEEQRFGVEHKEKIKELKKSVDVLSLSATPIPRTLQMSLIGLRGLSTLDTPPSNRYPIQTYVVHKSENLIKEVIMRELERNGQVFYLYNNVEEIYNVASKIRKNIPYANVEVAHGQMSSGQIEDVMYRFYNNEINVLVCTTIVETGLDIPNANTIIVDNAQNFGLSQLYQIKGRVGRSDRIAYAYFLVPEKKQLSETASKRLDAIKEFTSLGSGYKIAMRDLTIRGAGDLLGPKQSGFIDNVGLDLYLSMLAKAIKKKRGEVLEEEKTLEKINIPISSAIPDSFNENDYEKLAMYHELDKIDNKKDLLNYYLKVEDEYGHLPKEVESLFEKKKLELLYNLHYIDSVTSKNSKFEIVLTKEYSDNIDGVKLFEYCTDLSKDIKISYKYGKLMLSVPSLKEAIDKILQLVDNLDKLEKK